MLSNEVNAPRSESFDAFPQEEEHERSPSPPRFDVRTAPLLNSSGNVLEGVFEVIIDGDKQHRIVRHKEASHVQAKEKIGELFDVYQTKVTDLVKKGKAILPPGQTVESWIEAEKRLLAEAVDLLCSCC